MSKPTVIVYGATAFSAKELVNYLDNHEEADDFDIILAGRNRSKLEKVASSLQKRHEIVACELNDEEGVKSLVARGNVVVNLAGPYRWHNAEALIRECAGTGKHYVDLTGESDWLSKHIVPEYDYLASKTGACIVPSCGFDSIPSDISVYLALKTLQTKYPDASITNSISYFKLKGTISGGTIQSMHSVAELPREERNNSEWALVGRGFKGPQAKPKLIYELEHPAVSRPLIGSFFFMYPYNRTIVRRSWHLSRLDRGQLAKSDGEEDPVHGGGFVYEEALETGSRVGAVIATAVLAVFGILFFGSRLTRSIVSWLLPKAGQGASDEKLRKGFMSITNVSQTTQPGIDVVTTCKGQGDPGYIITTYMLAESALSLVLPPPKGTSLPRFAKQGGVLTTSTALGSVLIERLQKAGKVQWHSELVENAKTK